MTSVLACLSLLAVLLGVVTVSLTGTAESIKTLNLTNSCAYTVWPGISSSSGTPAGSAAAAAVPDDTTCYELAPGQWKLVAVPSGGWSGRMWGRTMCSTDINGRFSCGTGDCGTGRQDCTGGGGAAAPPVTLAQFTLNDGASGTDDVYDVSLVDGFNLPIMVAPGPQRAPAGPAAGGKCAPAGCAVDLNGECPAELRVSSAAVAGSTCAVACKSACQAFGSPVYCCTGAYGSPETCKPSDYSELWKKACPQAVTYAYDVDDSTFTCGAGSTATYVVTFCPPASTTTSTVEPSSPSPSSQAPPETSNQPSTTGGGGGGGQQVGEPWRIIVLVVALLGLVSAALGALANFLGLFERCGGRRRSC